MVDLEGLDATDWKQLEARYSQFLERELPDAAALEAWLLEMSDLDAYVSETAANLYIAMTCDTEDAEIKQAYLDFVEQIEPELAKMGDALNRKLAAHPAADDLPPYYQILLRETRMDVSLFREENIPLGTELAKLSQRYEEICGAMTVEFEGEERTLQQMAKFLQVTDRDVRERAWRAITARRAQDAEEIDTLFEKQIALRHQVALNAGYANHRDYIFDAKHRFDYTPAHCEAFHDAAEQVCVPLMRQLDAERETLLKVGKLRPWDLAVDVHGRDPLRPFEKVEEMVAGSSRMFHRMSAELGEFFDRMRDGTSLDLDSRKGKAPGGYQYNRAYSRKPFIFMNATGLQRNLETMVHEAGHAFHSYYADTQPLLDYRSAPMEFSEVASMSMELLCHPFLDEFNDEANADRARRSHLEGIVSILPWVATIDAFQHWIYTHPEHTRAERHAYWNTLIDRFGSAVEWEGLEHLRDIGWQRQLHLFSYPFYYIEYGIAQLGALQYWLQYRRDEETALANYATAMKLGGAASLPDLFEAGGLTFDFGPTTVRDLIDEVRAVLAELPA